MLLQVHDELVFEIGPGSGRRWTQLVRDKMGHAVEMTVPLDVSVGRRPFLARRRALSDARESDRDRSVRIAMRPCPDLSSAWMGRSADAGTVVSLTPLTREG